MKFYKYKYNRFNVKNSDPNACARYNLSHALEFEFSSHYKITRNCKIEVYNLNMQYSANYKL